MTDTTWTSAAASEPRQSTRESPVARTFARFWTIRVVTPLHRALDAALRAGELRALNPGTLGDIGYRRD